MLLKKKLIIQVTIDHAEVENAYLICERLQNEKESKFS